jgi:hypothetical protein
MAEQPKRKPPDPDDEPHIKDTPPVEGDPELGTIVGRQERARANEFDPTSKGNEQGEET